MERFKQKTISNPIQVNKNLFPIVSEIVNRFNNKVTIPARSIMYQSQYDVEGYPIYEFVDIEYWEINENSMNPTEQFDKIMYEKKPVQKSKLQSRVFHCCCFFRNPRTGEDYNISEEKIINCLEQKNNLDWGIGVHDRDMYLESDVEKHLEHLRNEYNKLNNKEENGLEKYINLNQKIFEGNQKPPHIHIPIGTKVGKNGRRNAIRLSTLSNLLEIPETCFQKKYDNTEKGGDDGFLDALIYLSHKNALEKFQYEDEVVTTSIDIEEAIEDRNKSLEKYGKANVNLRDKIRYAVEYEGISLKQIKDQYPMEYIQDIDKLNKLRRDYLKSRPMPSFKLNMYIGGINGGIGKGLMGKAIAKAIIDPSNEREDTEIFFKVTKEARFNGYEGQPVLIWEDFRPIDLMKFFDYDRGELFKVINPYPDEADGQANIKFDTTKLVNIINIFDCIMEPKEWLDSLAGEYIDKEGNVITSEEKQKAQVRRRIPIALWVIEEGFKISLNKGVLYGTREYNQYEESEYFRCSLQAIASRFGIKSEAYKEVSQKAIYPAIKSVQQVQETMKKEKNYNLEDILKEYENWGEPINIENPKDLKKIEIEEKIEEINKNKIDEINWEHIK